MSKKLKIAVIGLKGLPAFGGAATVGENIINQLADKYEFVVYSISTFTSQSTGQYKNYKQIVFKQKKKSPLNTLLYYLYSVIHVLIFEKCDIVHFHHNAASFFLPILRLKYKVILTTHGLFTEEKFHYVKNLYKLFDKVFLRFANIITTVSMEDYRQVVKLKKRNIYYIPNGINLSEKIFPQFENESDYILFAAGRIHKGKGCHIMLEALIKINYTGRVIITGDLDQTKDYKKVILQLASKLTNIRFTGMIKDKDLLFTLVKNAKLFVYPSHAEAMSIMMLEVSSLRTPIICCDCIVNRDIFNETHVLFAKKDNIDDWVDKINWALKNKNSMIHFAESSYMHVINRYLWDKISLEYINIYEKYDKK